MRNPFRARWAVYLTLPPILSGHRGRTELGRFMTRWSADFRAAELTNPPAGQAYARNLITVERLP